MKKLTKITKLLLSMMVIVSISLLTSCKDGAVGPMGPAGADGADGATGPAGADGADGAAGQDGQDGQDGANGADATIAIPTQADIDAYGLADGTTGARYYDNPANAVLDADAANTTWADADLGGASANFYRCKTCHGWDLLGRQGGALIGKAPSATYPIAVDVNLYQWARVNNIKTVFNAVKNVGGHAPTVADQSSLMADYSSLGDDAIWDLVKFLKETSHNVYEFYAEETFGTYPTGTKVRTDLGRGGDPVNGLAVWTAKCSGCHAADGTGIDIYCKGLSVGDMFRNDPHEIQHKGPWGMPTDRSHVAAGCSIPFGANMPVTAGLTDQDIRDLLVMGQDATAFPDL